MRTLFSAGAASFGLLALCFVAGCGPSYPETVPVNGVVTLDGQPVEGAAVLLMSQVPGSGNAARAVTNADGTFNLTTFKDNDGARPGSYKAIVKKTDLKNQGAANESLVEESLGARPVQEVELLPAKYGALQTTPFDVEVKPEMELPLKLELKSQ
ncbi:MAG TPA: carboxypeptidase-like regulatory domain-containing protein [Pirellulaceae bacterium]|jgi:hypothetical protein|nr:carboxypeptidase-like regulatory domain-containing protein [Pirellulaceae bacterium]